MSNIVKRKSNEMSLQGALADIFGDVWAQSAGDDLTGGVSVGFPVLSIKGKVFHIKQGGEAELVCQPNSDDPATSLEVVLLKANPHISKVFYANGYVEGSEDKPTCYSNNGVAPEDDSEEKQSSKCATCPKNAWGSRVTDDGRKGKACSDSRRIAVAPAGDLGEPMLLRVPAASLRPLSEYGKALNKRGVPYQAVVTKLSFDHTVAHPLLKFAPVRALTPEDAKLAVETINGDVVEAILSASVADVPPERDEEDEDGESFENVAKDVKAHQQAPAPTPAPAPSPAPRRTTKQTETKPAATVSMDDVASALGDTLDTLKGTGTTAKPASSTKTAAAAANAPTVDGGELGGALDALLSDFEQQDGTD